MPEEDKEANMMELVTGEGRIMARYEAAAGLEEDILYHFLFFGKQS